MTELPEPEFVTDTVRDQLAEDGYVVIPDVIDAKSCDYVIDGFWNWLERQGTGVVRSDPKTMRGSAWPATSHNMIQHHRVGHLAEVWSARLATRQIFAELHGTNELLTSFDAINMARPPELCGVTYAPEAAGGLGQAEIKLNRHWFHVDHQLRFDQSEQDCIQGCLNLSESGVDDAALVVLPGAHNYLEEMAQTYEAKADKEWYKLSNDQVDWFQDRTGKAPIRVAAPRGSLTLWHSRLPHCGVSARRGRAEARWRYGVYVCMTPRAWATPAALAKRRKAYQEQRMTAHSPHHVRLVPLKSQFSDGTQVSFTDPVPELETNTDMDELIS